ncbi:lysophospholipid acyltransferase family protein [Entomobacter blattae]|nr:lauroyl acyltransferase [Entomobacter blattae]
MILQFFYRLGPIKASNWGGWLFRSLGPYLPLSKIADTNLKLAYPVSLKQQRQSIIKGMWENLGRNFGEFPHLSALRQNTPYGPGWEVTGEQTLIEQAKKGGAVIFISGHIGNWEMLPPAVAHYGLAFSSFYRAANNPLVDELIKSYRLKALKTTIPLFAKGATGARKALLHLARGGRLGMLMDQKMNDGIQATFFNHPAMTASAAAAMALRFGCPLIPGYVERLGPARLRIVVAPPLSFQPTGDTPEDEHQLTQTINDLLEVWIRKAPQNWLWLHKRWPLA